MAENLKRQPKKGILKNSSSFESNEKSKDSKPATKWDEMNILATLHPADKDYGHMKIDEPKTPYNYAKDTSGSGDELDSIDVDALAKRLQEGGNNGPRSALTPPPADSSDEDESPEQKEIRKKFEMKRKKHYNEFQAVKLARQLMAADEEEEESEETGEVNEQKQAKEPREDSTEGLSCNTVMESQTSDL